MNYETDWNDHRTSFRATGGGGTLLSFLPFRESLFTMMAWPPSRRRTHRGGMGTLGTDSLDGGSEISSWRFVRPPPRKQRTKPTAAGLLLCSGLSTG